MHFERNTSDYHGFYVIIFLPDGYKDEVVQIGLAVWVGVWGSMMKVFIEEIAPSEEEKIVIRCNTLTARQMRAVEILRETEYVIAYKEAVIFRLPMEDIFYCEAVDNKMFAYTRADLYEMKRRFAEVEELLEDRFIRISRTVLLNWEKVISLRPMMNGKLTATLENEEQIVISRQYVNALKGKFGV